VRGVLTAMTEGMGNDVDVDECKEGIGDEYKDGN
jgi:hypothetical protein